jgi:hypothetical protein
MQLTQDLRGIDGDAAEGMAAKAQEFQDGGGELYVAAEESAAE